MKSSAFRKVDPRLLRLLPSGPPAIGNGIIAAAFPVIAGPSIEHQDVEVLVSLSGLNPPPGFGRSWFRVAPGFYTAVISRQLIPRLAESPEVESIDFPRAFIGETQTSIGAINVRALHEAPLTRTGKGVVVGIIDFGLDYTLEDFRTESGETRVQWLWDQELTKEPGEKVPSYGYGVEYNAADINRAIRNRDPRTIVRHHPKTNHGTQVAGVAASSRRDSRGRYLGVAPDADLIFVNLSLRRGAANSYNSQNVTNAARVVEAIQYIFSKVGEMRGTGGAAPACVINMSVGQNASGHDGDSPVEREIDALLDRTAGRAIVVAAGNSGDSAIHATWQYNARASVELALEVRAFTPGQSSCELETWHSSRDLIDIAVRPPNAAEFSEPIQPPFDDRVNFGGTTAYVLARRFDPRGGDSRIYISLGENYSVVPRGTWTIRFRASQDSHPGTLHAWIEKTADLSTFKPRFASPAEVNTTIGSPATARRAISVANVDSEGTLHPTSGRGPTRDGRRKPDLAAPGVDIVSCTVTPPGAKQVLTAAGTGTSFSAPHVTGIAACLLEEDPDLRAEQLQKILVAASDGQVFDEGRGFGLIDAQRALDLLRGFL